MAEDLSVSVARNADRCVWAAGTNVQRAPVNPETVPTDALDRVYGLSARLTLEQDGNLVVTQRASTSPTTKPGGPE